MKKVSMEKLIAEQYEEYKRLNPNSKDSFDEFYNDTINGFYEGYGSEIYDEYKMELNTRKKLKYMSEEYKQKRAKLLYAKINAINSTVESFR